DVVPRIELTLDGTTRTEHAGHWWELIEWRPGCADFREHPTTARLEAACRALARLHCVWGERIAHVEESPAVVRRRDSLRVWKEHRDAGWHPLARCSQNDSLRPLIERTWELVMRWVDRVPGWLVSWSAIRWPVQPCLCDVWHDHLLFDGDRLTGLI